MPRVYAAHTLHVNAAYTRVDARDYRGRVEQHDQTRKDGLGARLKAAREQADYTQDGAGQQLGVKKATISSWENGRNIPDALMLARLAKLYGTTADALLWDDSISIEAIRFAAQYDALTDQQQRAFRAMWLAYFEQSKSDHEVEQAMPATKAITS